MKTEVALTLVVLLAVSIAYSLPFAVKAKIDFPFSVGGKVLAAGNYEFTRDDAGMVFRVEDMNKNGALAPIVTRLTREMHAMPNEAYLVFDKVGEDYLLSEIWAPGEDGYLLLATKGEHTHKVVEMK